MMEPSASEATNYEPLSKARRGLSLDDDPPDSTDPPKDTRHIVYLTLLTAGIGFVLPYNSFIVAADYWQLRFPGRSVALDMSMTYILVAFLTVLLNNVLLSLAPFRVRVTLGYALSFTTLVFVAVCEVAWHLFSSATAYPVCLTAVSLVAIGCTMQQASFYGFASQLPKRYTQAVMVGESVAGFLVSSNRVATKLLISNDRVSTVIFFLTSTVYIAFSYVLHSVTSQSPFVRYYTKQCSNAALVPEEDHSLTENNRRSQQYGVLSLEPTSASVVQPISFSNPVYDLTNPSGNSNSAIDASGSSTETTNPVLSETVSPSAEPDDLPDVAFKMDHITTPSQGRYRSLRSGLTSRLRVVRAIYPYMACIALAYCVTLSLYPGIESEIISCDLGNWMPVLLMFTFNAGDVVGKMLAAIPYAWSRRQLVMMSTLRTLIVPLLLLCCAPRENPIIAGETPAFVFTAFFGLTNGLAGSLPMILAPAKVPSTLKEVTGNLMTLSYNVGLTVGSLIGYIFDGMLGQQLTDFSKICPVYPYAPLKSTTSTTTASTPAAQLLTASTTAAALTTLLQKVTTAALSSTTGVASTPSTPSTLASTLMTSESTAVLTTGGFSTMTAMELAAENITTLLSSGATPF